MDCEAACKRDEILDVAALATANLTFSNSFLETVIRECSQDLQATLMLRFIAECVCQHIQILQSGKFTWGSQVNQNFQFPYISQCASFAFLQIALNASNNLIEISQELLIVQLSLTTECMVDILAHNVSQVPC